ncbi:hypothetical protein X907_0488 [Glycocaulis alkaliphilus]|uniref:Uncharacterized protein n=1 Tax=Glycocaulis alkaliphilus TaxID=1434191 RepID=A0A3T0E758_9PROT|nr:hypothetical protein X907_0488 [Glycocaulis alkaliphilus]
MAKGCRTIPVVPGPGRFVLSCFALAAFVPRPQAEAQIGARSGHKHILM